MTAHPPQPRLTRLTRLWIAMDQAALLDDLDQRQNAVLEQLAALNTSIETLLKECLAARDQAVDSLHTHQIAVPRESPKAA